MDQRTNYPDQARPVSAICATLHCMSVRTALLVSLLVSFLVGCTGGDGEQTIDAMAPPPIDAVGTPPIDAMGTGDAGACEVAADCQWGEIDHEILTKEDCICLFGCPYLALSKTTVERRLTQYAALCNPNEDGQGNLCPIDDCAQPPILMCTDKTCVAPGVAPSL